MTLFRDIQLAGFTERQWQAWELSAYFPTTAELRPLARRLGFAASDPSFVFSSEWYANRLREIVEFITAPVRRASLHVVAEQCGLRADVLDERLMDESDERLAFRRDGYRSFLGALYWEYQRQSRAAQRTQARADWAFDQDIISARFNLPGAILLGDGCSRFNRPGDELPILDVRFDRREPWGPHNDPLNAGPEAEMQTWLGYVLWAHGWLKLASLQAEGRSAWNGSLARLARLTQVDNENSHRLQLEPTTYVAQHATTFGWKNWTRWAADAEKPAWRTETAAALLLQLERTEAQLESLRTVGEAARRESAQRELDIADLRSLRERLVDRGFPRGGLVAAARRRRADLDLAYSQHDIEASRLANALSANVTVISSDGTFYLQRRNTSKVGEGRFDWQTTAAGFIDLAKDLDGLGQPSLWETMARESLEEFGWRLWAPALGIFWEGRKREVGVLAFARSRIPDAEIRVPFVETTEALGFRPMPFEASTVFSFACAKQVDTTTGPIDAGAAERSEVDGPVTGPWANFMPLGAASIIFALAHQTAGRLNDGRCADAWHDLVQAFDEELRKSRMAR